MPTIQQLIQDLDDPSPTKRYRACEELRRPASLPPEAIIALQRVENDPFPEVAAMAKAVLAMHAPLLHASLPSGKIPMATDQLPPVQPTSTMPLTAPNAPEYISALERRLMAAEGQITRLQAAVAKGGYGANSAAAQLPDTAVISRNFLSRAFAIWGHYFVAQLIIGVAVYCLIFLAGLLITIPTALGN